MSPGPSKRKKAQSSPSSVILLFRFQSQYQTSQKSPTLPYATAFAVRNLKRDGFQIVDGERNKIGLSEGLLGGDFGGEDAAIVEESDKSGLPMVYVPCIGLGTVEISHVHERFSLALPTR